MKTAAAFLGALMLSWLPARPCAAAKRDPKAYEESRYISESPERGGSYRFDENGLPAEPGSKKKDDKGKSSGRPKRPRKSNSKPEKHRPGGDAPAAAAPGGAYPPEEPASGGAPPKEDKPPSAPPKEKAPDPSPGDANSASGGGGGGGGVKIEGGPAAGSPAPPGPPPAASGGGTSLGDAVPGDEKPQ